MVASKSGTFCVWTITELAVFLIQSSPDVIVSSVAHSVLLSFPTITINGGVLSRVRLSQRFGGPR